MAKEPNVPSIRFNEFSDAWVQHKLKDIVERVIRRNTNNESSLPLTISAQYGLVDQITYFNNRVASRDISNYYLVNNGEFAYNKSTSEGYPFGVIKRLDLYEKGVLSTLYIVFGIKDPQITNSDFMVSFFATDRWHKGVAEKASEGIRNHGLLNIAADDFMNIKVKCPNMEYEQSRIGALFRNLDNLTTLHQRKLNKYKNIKKAMLKKMFPQDGSTVPEIRFGGYTNDWEQKKLSDFADKAVDNRGKTPPLDSKGTHPLIELASLGAGFPDYSKVEKYLNDYSFENHLRDYIKKGDILFSTVGSIGLVSLMDNRENAAIAQNIVAFRAKENYSSEYLYALFSNESNKAKANKIAMGAVQPSIKVSQLIDVEYLVTNNKREQKQIGSFFLQLDDLIKHHQLKLEKLKNIKKAFLEKMFV